MDVSVIIINYNTKELTADCISSLQKYTVGVSYEVILVDNASSDGSDEYFRNDRRVIFIQSGSNLGFGRANNLGILKAKGKYVFLLNSDTLLKNNAIKIFFDSMETMPIDVACLGCILRNKDMQPITSFGKFPKWYNEFIKRKKKFPTNKVTFYPAIVDYITGADLFMRKEIIDYLGAFDPDFFLYYEETEMQKRYHNAGYKSVIIDGPLICHLEGASSNSFQKTYFMTQGYLLYLKKSMPKLSYLCFRIILPFKRIILLPTKGWTFPEMMKFVHLLLKHS